MSRDRNTIFEDIVRIYDMKKLAYDKPLPDNYEIQSVNGDGSSYIHKILTEEERQQVNSLKTELRGEQ